MHDPIMTTLASIRTNHLALTCRLCGHSSALAVADIPDTIGTVAQVTQEHLNVVARELNERPRKTLNYFSPAEKFEECVAAIG